MSTVCSCRERVKNQVYSISWSEEWHTHCVHSDTSRVNVWSFRVRQHTCCHEHNHVSLCTFISPKSECDDGFFRVQQLLVAMKTFDIISSLRTFIFYFMGEPACTFCSSPNSLCPHRSLELLLWSVCNDSGSFTHTSNLF